MNTLNLEVVKNKVGNNKVFVTGHKVTDVDSYVSMILMSNLLKTQGINAEPFLFYDYNDVDSITKEVIEKLGFDEIKKHEVMPGDYVFLVDHNNPYESVKDIAVNIVGIIDHHEDEGTCAPFKTVEKMGSTTELIYSLYKRCNVELTAQELKSILYSLCVDTCALMNSKTQESDKEFAKKIAEELNIDFNMVKKETLFETDITKSVKELLNNGKKEYHMNDFLVASAYVEVVEKTKEFELKVNEILAEAEKTQYDLFLFIINDFECGKTIVQSFGKLKEQIKNREYSFIASRGTTIIPEIREEISKL